MWVCYNRSIKHLFFKGFSWVDDVALILFLLKQDYTSGKQLDNECGDVMES